MNYEDIYSKLDGILDGISQAIHLPHFEESLGKIMFMLGSIYGRLGELRDRIGENDDNSSDTS